MLRRSNLSVICAPPGDFESALTADLQRFRPRTILTDRGRTHRGFHRRLLSQLQRPRLHGEKARTCGGWPSAALACLICGVRRCRLWPCPRAALRRHLIAQVAASIITAVAPAGVGPAALNLRYLRKRRVPTAAAVTAVTLCADLAGAHHDSHPPAARHGFSAGSSLSNSPPSRGPSRSSCSRSASSWQSQRYAAGLAKIEPTAGLPASPVIITSSPGRRRGWRNLLMNTATWARSDRRRSLSGWLANFSTAAITYLDRERGGVLSLLRYRYLSKWHSPRV